MSFHPTLGPCDVAPVMGCPPAWALTLRQKVRMKGVFEMLADIGSEPPQPVTPGAGDWVFQAVKSTKHSVEAYVPVPGRANPQLLDDCATCASWVELNASAGTATSWYE